MRARRLTAIFAALISGLALAACGGDDGESDDGNSDADQIAEVIETTTTSSAPDHCTELQTQEFVEQIEFEEGEAAIEACKADADETSGDADSVEVSEIEVDGETATANVTFDGSVFDQQTLVLELIADGDQWKLNRIADIKDLDVEAYAASFEELVQQGDDPSTPEQAACVKDHLTAEDAPTAEVLTDALLSGSESSILTVVGDCFGGG